MTAFRLAHISDLHLPPPPRQAGERWTLKRALSRLAWRRKGRWHQPQMLATIIADLKAQAPDHIALTGDLTNFSTPAEYAAAAAWLADLAAPGDLTLSPGNHDALVGVADTERFAPWRPWLGESPDSEFPHLRRVGPLALIALCSALPTAPGLAQGELGAAQLQRLGRLLEETRAQGLCRVVLIHHPPTKGVVSRRKALRDQEGLAAVLKAQGAELLLHGHAHAATVATTPGPDRAIPSLGAPSASAIGGHYERARWHCLEIERAKTGWRIAVVARGPDADGLVRELGRYQLLTA